TSLYLVEVIRQLVGDNPADRRLFCVIEPVSFAGGGDRRDLRSCDAIEVRRWAGIGDLAMLVHPCVAEPSCDILAGGIHNLLGYSDEKARGVDRSGNEDRAALQRLRE